MSSVLVTGANRGLGLAFARHYGSDGWQVTATCREPETATELRRFAEKSAGQVTIEKLDVLATDYVRYRSLYPVRWGKNCLVIEG